MINVGVNICIDVAWLGMLEEIILIILSLTATSVIDHLLDLSIWRRTNEPVLVVKLQLLRNNVLMVLFQLLLLLRNGVLFQSLSCKRLVIRLEAL